MSKKKVTALSHQQRPQEPNPTHMIPASDAAVKNVLVELRNSKGIQAKEMVPVVQAIYPKYDKQLQSRVEHGDETGIQLLPDAMRAILEKFAPERLERRRKAKRSKANRIQARLSDDVYTRLQLAVKANNDTIQDILERAILRYLAEKGDQHDPTAQ